MIARHSTARCLGGFVFYIISFLSRLCNMTPDQEKDFHEMHAL